MNFQIYTSYSFFAFQSVVQGRKGWDFLVHWILHRISVKVNMTIMTIIIVEKENLKSLVYLSAMKYDDDDVGQKSIYLAI